MTRSYNEIDAGWTSSLEAGSLPANEEDVCFPHEANAFSSVEAQNRRISNDFTNEVEVRGCMMRTF